MATVVPALKLRRMLGSREARMHSLKAFPHRGALKQQIFNLRFVLADPMIATQNSRV